MEVVKHLEGSLLGALSHQLRPTNGSVLYLDDVKLLEHTKHLRSPSLPSKAGSLALLHSAQGVYGSQEDFLGALAAANAIVSFLFVKCDCVVQVFASCVTRMVPRIEALVNR